MSEPAQGPRIFWEIAPTPEAQPTLDWLEREGWCWGIEAGPFTEGAALRTLEQRGFQVIAHMHAHPETCREHWEYLHQFTGRPVPDFDAAMRRFLDALDGPLVANYFIEDDSSGVGFSGEFLKHPPKDHAEAKAMFDRYMAEGMARARRYPDVAAWGMIGYASTAHAYARHGVACIIAERANDDVEDLQTAVAFCRGASRQYGCEWGIDLSLWWGVIYGCVHQLPASLYTRHLYLSFFSGATAYRIEGGGFLLGDPDNPLPVAAAVADFGRRVQGVDPGEPEVPVALMLPADAGWLTPPYWRTTNTAWNYARLPYRQGERGIDGFFGAAFPGMCYAMDPFPAGAYADDNPPASPYALSCVTPEFAPTPDDVYKAEPPIPFGRFESRTQARETFINQRLDPSPYRAMGDSRWGDIFDVLTEDAGGDVLARYRVLALLGPVPMDAGLRARLEAYVRAGGTLVWAAGVAGPEDAGLCGAAIQPELRVGRAWQWEDGAPVHEAFRYVPVECAEAKPLCTTPDGAPVAIRRALGQGAVYTCLIPWFEAGHAKLCGAALALFDAVIGRVQPVRVDGLPVEWLSTRGAAARTVVVANHDGAAWEGTVHVRALDPALTACRELLTETNVAFTRTDDHGARVGLAIPPYGVRVLRWTK